MPSPRLAIAAALLLPALTCAAWAAGKPSSASDRISGVGEFWIANSFLDAGSPNVNPGDDSYLGLGGEMRLNLPIDDGWAVQLDLLSESAFVDDTGENYSGSVLGGAHVSWRDPGQWLAGGFLAAGNGHNASDDTANAWLMGVEGQYYLSAWTFYAQLGWLDAEDAGGGIPNAFRDAVFGRGVVRYFLDAGGKLEGELSYASGEQEFTAGDMDVWGWGLRYDRRIASLGSSLFLAYEGAAYESEADNPSNELTEHIIKAGLSFAFGIEDQKAVDRRGATLDLPVATRWSAYGVDVVN